MERRKEPFKVKTTTWTNHRNEKFVQIAEYYKNGLTIFYDVEEEKIKKKETVKIWLLKE